MKEAISYIRVSSEEQADSGLGLEAQRQRIAAYCIMKGLHLAEEFEDPGISAGKPLASRPAGSRLLAAAKKSKAVVIVAKLDRLFRSVADAANVIDDFDKKGIQRISFDGCPPDQHGVALRESGRQITCVDPSQFGERDGLSLCRPIHDWFLPCPQGSALGWGN